MTKSSKYHWLLAMTPFQRSYIQGLIGNPEMTGNLTDVREMSAEKSCLGKLCHQQLN